MSAAAKQQLGGDRGPHPGWEDQRLVNDCLRGTEAAWGALVEKYKNLVYAVARKGGLPPDEAADVFQAVWVDAFEELPKLRKKSSVRSWLITITRRKCYHWRHQRQTERDRHGSVAEALATDSDLAVDPVAIEELERDQLVREAIQLLPPRCRELVHMLFYSEPPRPYREVAEELGLAIGSIGFIRGRCLKRLERNLVRHGVA